MECSPDGETIASAGLDNVVNLWQLDGTHIATLDDHDDRVMAVQFSPDGEAIASASADGTVRLWHRNIDRLVAYGCRQLWGEIQITDRLEDIDRHSAKT